MNIDEKGKTTYRLNWLYFYLTAGCNLRCRHCWIDPKYQTTDKAYPVLDVKLFHSIIKQAKLLGLSGVKLTGGEPLLHPNIHKILDIIYSEDIRLNMETNGVLCTSELVEKIIKCKNPFVSVSIDGADAEIHEWVRGVDGCFDEAIEGVKNLIKAGMKPQIIMSIMRHNKHQIKDIIHLAEELGAGSVKFNIVQPTARGEKMHEIGEALSVEELIELGKWIEQSVSKSSKLRILYSHPVAFRPLSRIFRNNKTVRSGCDILGIIGVLADGSYSICGIGATVPELIFGNAAKDSLENIWNNNPILLELREGVPDNLTGICNECLMKKTCLGYCIAHNYYANKNLWASYWYCEEANKLGLFPKTRKK